MYEIQNAINKLNELKAKKMVLSRPVFFVPGWTGADCSSWTGSVVLKNEPERLSAQAWFEQIFSNSNSLYFIDFIQEDNCCKSFLEFGVVLRNKIWGHIGKNQEFDIIGHSMGGLDIRAAITQDDPLLNCKNCITVATPEQGSQLGGLNNFLLKTFLRPIILRFKPMTTMQIEQSLYLDPDYAPIKEINSLDKVKLFFDRIDKLYQLKGTQDSTVMDSAFIKFVGTDISYQNKIKSIPVNSCDHASSTKGITTDPRTIAVIALILTNQEIPGPEENLGVLAQGNYKPEDESTRIV